MAGSLWPATGAAVVAAIAVALFPAAVEAGVPLPYQLRPRASPVVPRASTNPETVVLADCLDSSWVISSQMAYFPGAPNDHPQDVAIVATTPKEAALWVNSETAARFTTTNTVFVATIGPKVAQGKYAGSGNNGYPGNFSCWEEYVPKLYKYGDTVCSQVYLCDKRDPPTVVAVVSPTSSVAAGPSNSLLPADGQAEVADAPPSRGLSEAALIAIVVSIVGVAAIIAATSAVLWFRRRLRRKELGEAYDRSSDPDRGCCGLFGWRRRKERDPFPNGAELPTDHDRNEMPCDGPRPRAVELPDTSDRFELDAGGDGIMWSDLKKEDVYSATDTKWAEEKGKEPAEPMELPLVSPLSPDEETSKFRRNDEPS